MEQVLERGVAIVIDIGKTHSKVSLWSRDGRCLDKLSRANQVQAAAPYVPLDTAATADWLIEALQAFAAHPVEAIIPVAHGAAVAGIRDGVLAFASPDYEWEIPAETLADYRARRDPFRVTGSPALPAGLNIGSQLHYLEATHPAQFREATLLPYAQYWAWLLSGTAVSEVTSLGCHSDLWETGARAFSPLAKRRGWAERFAPLVKAGDVVGTLQPGLAKLTGLSPDVRIYAGVHDSNAALHAARGFAEIEGREATVLSTGTWFIAMRLSHNTADSVTLNLFQGPSSRKLGASRRKGNGEVVSGKPRSNWDQKWVLKQVQDDEGLSSGNIASVLPEHRDCLINVDVYGQPVDSARYMGGREIELLGARIDQSGTEGLNDALNSQMILPSQVPGCGPFPEATSLAPSNPSPAAVALYAALMTDAALDLIGARGRLLIEGRFAASELFTRALATLRPDTALYTAASEADASFGALRLIWPDLRPDGALQPVMPLDADLHSYRQNWQNEIKRRGTEQ